MENSFTQKVILAQAAIGTLHRDATNPHFKSKYTTLDHILEAERPALAAHGLLLSQHLTATDTVITRISDEDNELVSEVRICGGNTTNPQQFGSAVTYARRYALTALLAISTDADDDGELVAANRPSPVATADPVEAVRRIVDAPLPVKEKVPIEKVIESARTTLYSAHHGNGFDQELAARIMAAGEVACHFGKHASVKLRDMKPDFVLWWSNRDLVANPKTGTVNEDDVNWKASAALWHRGIAEPDLLIGYDAGSVYETEDAPADPDDDIPF
jgi:hypothetical protein